MNINRILMKLENKKYALEQKIELLKKMKQINELIFSAQENVIEIEQMNEDINDFKPFLSNYPFNCSFDEISTEWGNIEEGEQIEEKF